MKTKSDEAEIKANDSCDVQQALLPIKEALENLESKANPVKRIETVALNDALGRILAEDLLSEINVPPADNSAMDGYAVRAADLSRDSAQGQTVLTISQRICAGESGVALEEGTAARIFTGAPIPEGADAVVMQEKCEAYAETNDEKSDEKIVINGTINSGSNIRKAGEDILSNTVILKAGQKLRAQDIGLAASIGFAELPVKRRLKVAVFFTGDELRNPGETLKAGQIYNSNRYTLSGLLESLACEVIDLGNIEDTLDATLEAMRSAAQQADLVMTSGGVSVGEEDHIRKALEQIGTLDMWRVNIKPGKPFAFGEIHDTTDNENTGTHQHTPFMGLPGNPVSVFATICIFARPYILKTQGARNTKAFSYKVASAFECDGTESRNEYLRARMEVSETGQAIVGIYENQSSGVLNSASWANGFAFIPAKAQVKKGDLIDFTPFSELSIS